jgi:hypothetical protein
VPRGSRHLGERRPVHAVLGVRCWTGNANQLLYSLFNSRASGRSFHDITPTRQGPNNNGLYPVTPGSDMATGIGSPIMASIITGSQ